jgi:glycosyltransferase involved in cell wall biosynthesis
MLIILSTHPIQYQVPLWQALARDGRVPFEVWYLSDHGTRVSHDKEFGTHFAWDLDMLAGYPHQFLKTPPDVTPASFWKCRSSEPLAAKLRACGAKALWIQGWQVAGYWQAVHEARKTGVKVWLRGESNDLAPPAALWKQWVKRVLLGWLFGRVDKFLCIGRANRRLYESYGIGADRLLQAPYCVDNERFGRQKAEMEKQKAEIRKRWGIADDAFCVLFCGKFIPKKRPLDLVKAAALLIENKRLPNLHLLFTGSGELGPELRAACHVVFDAETLNVQRSTFNLEPPRASFAGFLNQTQISEAYVAADCLVLPSDYGETWGLVVNEAMASGLPCVISDRCGSAEDLGVQPPNQTFSFGDCNMLADCLCKLAQPEANRTVPPQLLDGFSFQNSVQTVAEVYSTLTQL